MTVSDAIFEKRAALRQAGVSPEKLAQYSKSFNTPDGYARDRLGMTLHPKQAAVLRDLFSKEKSRLAWFCSNEVGKTSRVAVAAILYALEMLDAHVQVTSGSDRQLKEQLVPHLKRQAWRFPEWDFLDRSIKVNRINQALFYAAKDQGTFQGFHEETDPKMGQIPQLIICDESAALRDEILMSAEDRCNPTWLLFMGSPLDPAGLFYQMSRERSAFYSVHRLNKLECTRERGFWHDSHDIIRTICKNTGMDELTVRDIVRAGEHRGEIKDPMTLSSVFGEFSVFVEYALLTLTEFEKCVENPPPEARGSAHGFFDFAGGRAKNVAALRLGNRVFVEKKWVEPNEMTAVGEFVLILKKWQREYGVSPEDVDGDGDGLGGPMVRRIQELGYNIGDFHGGSAPRFNDRYKDAWTEAWDETARKIKSCDLILPKDEDFRGQMLGRKIKPISSGQMKLETKEEMRKRNLPSPDEADAICMAAMPANTLRSFNVSRKIENYEQQTENETGSRRYFT